MNYEVAMEMQRICTGETRELTRGQIAEEVIDLKKLMKDLNPETVEKCTAFYNELIKSGEKKPYDVDALAEESESVKAEFSRFITDNSGDGAFYRLYNDIEDFFNVPPFEGLDNIEYGVHEVCVFSILEYFIWKASPKHDHEACRSEYRDSIARRTFEEVAEKWIKVYDGLQKRYDTIEDDMEGDMKEEHSLKVKLAACCIVAIAAIRDQDDFALDMAQSGAVKKAEEIVDLYIDDTTMEEESSFSGNVVRLFKFVYGYVRDIREAK